MISIIVSSYQEEYFIQFEQNVAETIGVAYEIIRIYNPGLMGICEAYNKGAEQARYDMLCFSHEDIVFKTANWGQTVIHLLENESVGLIGVAGSSYKTATPSGWGTVPQARSVNIIQHYRHSDTDTYHHYENPKSKPLVPVACVDGVWMSTRKDVWRKNIFDQQAFKGFHCYDLDFSLQIFRQYQILVTYDILIEHFSEGKNDRGWTEANLVFHRKWKKILPLNPDRIPLRDVRQYETLAGIEFVNQMGYFGYSLFAQLSMLIRFLFMPAINHVKVMRSIVRITRGAFKKRNG